jgi:chromosome segregation ATPase
MSDEELIARLRHVHDDPSDIRDLAADRIEALTEQLAAARQDAKFAEDELEMQEQEACMMENDYIKLEKERDALEAKLATCEKYRDAYAEMGRIGTQAVRDLEAKLAKTMELLILCRDMFDEVAHPSDPLSVMLNETLAEIKGESHA